ncbi:MAG: efflux RND transporter periplasmic adaptor subunit [Marinilabilia sp.]
MIRPLLQPAALALIILSWGCGARNPANEEENKEQRLEEYNEQANELKRKITDLKAELNEESEINKVNVEVTELRPVLFEQFIEAMGTVSTDQNIIVNPESSGLIRTMETGEGEFVKEGQVLARLNTESIEQSIAEIEENLGLARTIYERRKKLWDQNIGSEIEFIQAESEMKALQNKRRNLEAQLSMAVIKAPIDGVIDKLFQNEGEMAGPALSFARIVNLDNVYITADISEKYLNQSKPGDPVSVHFPALNLTREAEVYRTSRYIDPDTRTFNIRVSLENKDHQLLPNLMGEVKLRVSSIEDALVVPSLLIKKDFNGEFIFVADESQDPPVAEKRYIKTGIKDNNKTIVTEGLESKAMIITKGFAQVTNGTYLNIQ